ncbi:hypothetical protein EGI22_02590 [Lacihabitans sp. LS3-19]|uniref:hypothetical protein n=1 Tax=Lacihabitans sp. LS3-19 TaxID=2487335 RepID=UPI0020CD0DF9|nr:hypothetical protein [Lacihabitans sp. LS3-19]MCP9766779.1 hypothetical protein [Lacihabitans sp. LS3-19]
MWNKKLILIICAFILPFIVFAQNGDDDSGIDTKTLSYGLTTNNYSSLLGGVILRNSFPVSKRKNNPVNRYISVEAINLKNPREQNILSAYGSKFVYGKTNYFFSIRPQYGREYYFFQKDDENSIGFSVIVAGGPSIGLSKPYYIKYTNSKGDSPQTVQYNPDIQTNASYIIGAGNILQNLFTGLKFNPGLHAKIAANIDISTFNNNVTGVEIGTLFEAFAKKPEILAPKFSDNPQTFATLYLTLYFGNKKLVKNKKNGSKGTK